MPVGFTNTGALEPHVARKPRRAKTASPGPGHYEDHESYKHSATCTAAPRSAFGAYTDRRFREKKDKLVTPSPDQYPPRTTCGPTFNASFSNPVIPRFSKSYFEEKVHVTPGPSDYRPEDYKQKHTPASQFGGETVSGKPDRFSGSSGFHRRIKQAALLPAPGQYNPGGGIRTSKCPGAPVLGTSKRFRGDPALQVNHGPVASSARSRPPENPPGPGHYKNNSIYERQLLSTRKNPPGVRLGPRKGKASTSGHGRAQTAGSAKALTRRKIKKVASPGPLTYSQNPQFGSQADSLVRTTPQPKFGTAPRTMTFG